MRVTVLGITTFVPPHINSLLLLIIALQLFRESNVVLLESTVIFAKLGQP
jgi:hypothetical protein